MQLLAKAAGHGTTILCSLHQPRPQVLGLLDQVLLLSRGQVAYFGAPSAAASYFDTIGRPLFTAGNSRTVTRANLPEIDEGNDGTANSHGLERVGSSSALLGARSSVSGFLPGGGNEGQDEEGEGLLGAGDAMLDLIGDAEMAEDDGTAAGVRDGGGGRSPAGLVVMDPVVLLAKVRKRGRRDTWDSAPYSLSGSFDSMPSVLSQKPVLYDNFVQQPSRTSHTRSHRQEKTRPITSPRQGGGCLVKSRSSPIIRFLLLLMPSTSIACRKFISRRGRLFEFHVFLSHLCLHCYKAPCYPPLAPPHGVGVGSQAGYCFFCACVFFCGNDDSGLARSYCARWRTRSPRKGDDHTALCSDDETSMRQCEIHGCL